MFITGARLAGLYALTDRDNGQAGLVTPSGPAWALTTQALAANTSRIGRFVPSRNMTIVSIGFSVTTAAGADDSVDVGIYNSTLANILVHSGATAGKVNSTGAKTIAITPTALTAGTVYYAALSCGALGGTAGVLASLSYSIAANAALFGAAVPQVEVQASTSGHPLANAPTVIATPGAFLLALRES
jgi:hypothetical protein